MKLKNLFFGELLKNSIYAERFVNDAKGRFEDYSEVNPHYDPRGNIPFINLPYILVPKKDCLLLKSKPQKELLDWVYFDGKYRFFWHPDVLRNGFTPSGFVVVQPTSSTRTLLTENNPRVYIKTDLNKKHFRFIRRLRKSSVEHSIAVCDDLMEFGKTIPASSRYAFLPESLGLVLKRGEYADSGVLFRELKPYPYAKEPRIIIPYHSLYANDSYNVEDKPLVVQILELHANGKYLEYFVSEIIGPILEAWVLLVSKRGLLPELHGQNALAEINKDLRICRIVHRDFQSIYSDGLIRKDLNLFLFKKHIIGEEQGTTVRSQYSNVFDSLIGRYLLKRLIKTFCNYFKMDYYEIASAVKDYHHSIAGWEKAKFPKETYRFKLSAQEQQGNDVCLVDIGEKPEFR